MQIENLCINCMREKGTPGSICPHCGFDASTYTFNASHLPPYTILNGKYVLGRALGQGGFGIVYIGLDLYLNVTVAIKELFPANMMSRTPNGFTQKLDVSYVDSPDFTDEIKRKFIEEARTIAQLDDTEGVVSVKDLFEENGTAYMVMEYLEGRSLKEHLEEKGKMDYAELINLLRPVIDSLSFIHEHGIVHRDISPDNIMLLENGKAKLLDFGGAKDIRNSQNKSEIVQVKRGYTPIEQYQVNGNIGPWTDIYALCATIYRSITGKVPPEPMVADKEKITPPSKLGIKIPSDAEKTLMKGLEVDKEKRIQSVDELKKGLYSNRKLGSKPGVWKKILLIGIVVAGVLGAGAYGVMQLTGQSDHSDGKPAIQKESATVVTETPMTEQTATETKITETKTTEAETTEKIETTETTATTEKTETTETTATTEKETPEAVTEKSAIQEAELTLGEVCYIEPGNYIISNVSQPGIVVGIQNAYLDETMNVTTTEYSNYANNVLRLEENENGYYRIVVSHSNLGLVPNLDGQKVCQDSNAEAQWRFLYAGKGEGGENLFFIQNSDAECMAVETDGIGQPVVLKQYDESDPYEIWGLIPINEDDILPSNTSYASGYAWDVEEGLYQIQNLENPNVFWTVAGSYWDDGTNIVPEADNDTNCQKFYVKKREPGENLTYDIIAAHSSKYVCANEDTKLPAQYLEAPAEEGGWEFIYVVYDYFLIKNEADEYVSYDSDTGSIYLEEFNVDIDASQFWKLNVTEEKEGDYAAPINEGDYVEIADGSYEISSTLNDVSCWAMSQDESQATKSMIIWERVGDETQQFFFERLTGEADGTPPTYRIHPAQDMESVIGVSADGTLIESEWNQDDMQKWRIVYGGYGTYLIQSFTGQLVLCANGDITNGGLLVLDDYKDEIASAYKWYLHFSAS